MISNKELDESLALITENEKKVYLFKEIDQRNFEEY